MDFPLTAPLEVDARVLLFTLLLSLATSVLFGLAPALQATCTDLVPALKNDSSVARLPRWQFRDLLVGVQVALSAVLLIGSVTAVRSLRRALEIPLGFNPQDAVSLSSDLALEGYDEPRGREFQRRLLERAGGLPGIYSTALVNALPLSLNRSWNTIHVEGKPALKASEAPHATYYRVSPGYFRTVETRFFAGRDFDEHDPPGSPPVAMVNRTCARRLVGTEDAGGVRFRFSPASGRIQIRLAVGAAPMQVLGLVMLRMVLLVGSGVIAGGAAALVLGGWLAPVLHGTSAKHPDPC